MTNAWSLLYDELNMDTDILNLDTPIPGAMGDDHITFYLDMNKDPNRYKYDEDSILKELQDYILELIMLTTLLVMTKFRHLI